MLKAHKLFLQSPILFLIGFCLALTFPSDSAAQDTSARSIEVFGTGSASAKPDLLVVNAFITAEEKTAKKVLSEIYKTKEKLAETINPMDFPDVEIKLKDSLFNTNLNSEDMMMGAADEMSSDGYVLSQPIEIRIAINQSDTEKSTLQLLSKLVDTAEAVGVSFDEALDPMMSFTVQSGMSSLASGDLKDRKSLEKQATKLAFENARLEAEKLAELAGGKLGKVISIQASGPAGNDDSWGEYMNAMMGVTTAAKADSLLKIEVSRSLSVKFELID